MNRVMFKVKPAFGREWQCGCSDVGSVTDVDYVDDELCYLVGTPCGWSWVPAIRCVGVPFADCATCGADMTGVMVQLEGVTEDGGYAEDRLVLAEDADEDVYCGQDCLPNGLVQMARRASEP